MYTQTDLEQILALAARPDVDAVLIAGDVYNRASPSPEAIARWKSGEGTVAGMDLILVTEEGHVYITQGLEKGLETLGEGAGYTYEILRR